jgi:hypothetical protein
MSQTLLEKRVAALEQEVAGLKVKLTRQSNQDWKKTLGMFTDDPDMLEFFRDGLRVREENRRRTRPKPSRKKKSRA